VIPMLISDAYQVRFLAEGCGAAPTLQHRPCAYRGDL